MAMFRDRLAGTVCLLLAGFGCILAAPQASAETDLFSRETISVEGDLRGSFVDGERSWLDDAFGKLRYGGDNHGSVARARVAGIDVAWKPRLGWAATGLLSLTYQDGQEYAVDVNEAFLKFKPVPKGDTQYSARLGLFYPPVSLEHGGPNWSVVNSITPSAINSWIGEEVKVVALEATVSRTIDDHEISLTGAAFGYNDTSGTLLSYRGWALHDVKATAFGHLPLPPLSAFIAPYQGRHSNPVLELDDRIGYYARIEWRPPVPVSLYAFRYDNRGDRLSSSNQQTAWATTFWNVGATLAVGDKTRIMSQVLWGTTLVGPDTPFGYPVDVDFASAYILGVREVGRGSVSARIDVFKASDQSYTEFDNNKENGWAAMLGYKWPLSPHCDVMLEVQYVSSDRAGRSYGGVGAEQEQALAQTALRLKL